MVADDWWAFENMKDWEGDPKTSWFRGLANLTLLHSVVEPMCDRIRISVYGDGFNASVGRGGSLRDLSDSGQPEVLKLAEWWKGATKDGPLPSASLDQGSRRADAKADSRTYN